LISINPVLYYSLAQTWLARAGFYHFGSPSIATIALYSRQLAPGQAGLQGRSSTPLPNYYSDKSVFKASRALRGVGSTSRRPGQAIFQLGRSPYVLFYYYFFFLQAKNIYPVRKKASPLMVGLTQIL